MDVRTFRRLRLGIVKAFVGTDRIGFRLGGNVVVRFVCELFVCGRLPGFGLRVAGIQADQTCSGPFNHAIEPGFVTVEYSQ